MKPARKPFLAALLAVGALVLAPAASADRYHEDGWHGHEYGHRHGWRHGEHARHRHHAGHHHSRRHETTEVVVVNNYYSEAPPHRVVEVHEHVVERPVIVRERHRYRHERARHAGEYRSATPVILGGILGGVVGNHMGKGRGRDIATVAGVLLGGSIGRDLAH